MGLFDKFSSLLGRETLKPPECKPQRNEPCWCGSNVKYKKCHMPLDDKKGVYSPPSCCSTSS